MYEADDKMISIIRDNYSILSMLGSFGISLGFGDKTVKEVCESQNVDTYTFISMVNFTINGHRDSENIHKLSVPTLLRYLKASHVYYIDFTLPFLRRELCEALDENNNLSSLILRLYDNYAHSIKLHMKYEEKTLFPYVENLINGELKNSFDIETFSKHHSQIDQKLQELKHIIIQYLPNDAMRNNQLSHTLYDLYECQNWLHQHAEIEDEIFIPAIRRMEQGLRQDNVSQRISSMLGAGGDKRETLSEREKDVIIGVVQGMSNKEIADHLFISTNTVITHRRNIAKKLQIRTPAGLTVYAIVNNLVDISSVKL